MQPWQDEAIDRRVNEFVESAKLKLGGNSSKRDKEGDFSFERWNSASQLGVLSMCMPEPFGQNKSMVETIAAFEGLSEGCRDGGFLFALFNQVFGIQLTLVNRASDKLKSLYLPPLISGESLACYAFTEESGGSDLYSMKTTATETKDGFILNGKKTYLTNSPFSNLAIVFAKTQDNKSPFCLTAFFVDLSWKGVTQGRVFEKMGLRTVHMGELIFNNVFIPADHVISAKGAGMRILTESTIQERAFMTVSALGAMRRAIETCTDHCKVRISNDKPIGSFQQVSSKLANMIATYRVCRQLQYDIASKFDTKVSVNSLAESAAINKLFITENLIKFEMDAMQMLGVRGFLLDNFVQQDLRDSLAGTIWAGTSETLRNTIAKLHGLPVT